MSAPQPRRDQGHHSRPAIAQAPSGGDLQPPTLDIDLTSNDRRRMIGKAAGRGATLPVAARPQELYDGASAAAWGERDTCLLAAW